MRLGLKASALVMCLIMEIPVTVYADPNVDNGVAEASIESVEDSGIEDSGVDIIPAYTQSRQVSPSPSLSSSLSVIDTALLKRQNIEAYIEKIQRIDNDIANNMVELEKNKATIEELEQSIVETEKSIEEKQAEIITTMEFSGKRIRSLYEYSAQLGMIVTLLESEGLSDFITRAHNVVKVIKYDQTVMAGIKEDEIQLKEMREQKEEDKIQSEELLRISEEISEDLVTKKELLTTTLTKLTDEYSASYLGYQSTEAKGLEAELKELYQTYVFTAIENQEAYNNVIDTAPGIYEGVNLQTRLKFNPQDIIMYATGLLDIPYLWGGTTLQGFDCSGFVQYVYRHYGVYLPRVSEDQQNVGVRIENSADLLPGDLLFYGDPAHHVTMYVAPGFMIEAPQTGDIVKISAIRPYTRATRVVDWDNVMFAINEE